MNEDALVENHGSVMLLRCKTTPATDWAELNLTDDALRFGDAIVIEPRYVPDIISGMQADGLTVVLS